MTLATRLSLFLWYPATSYSPGCFHPRCFDPGNSHSRGPCPLLAIPDAPPTCILRGTRIVAGLARSLRFPTFACLHPPQAAAGFGPTGGGRLRSHRRRADGNLVKYGVRTHLEMIREENSLALHKRKHPTFVGCFLLWNPATSYSPGRFRPRCIRHRRRAGGNLVKYGVRTHLRRTGRV